MGMESELATNPLKLLSFSKCSSSVKALIFDDKLEQWVQVYSSTLCVLHDTASDLHALCGAD
jgi:hypothetical protein